MDKTFKNYITQFKTTSNPTHTSMDGGKYAIPDSATHAFWDNYAICVENDIPVHLTEKHLPDHSILLIDCDFRYSIDDNKRFHDDKTITDLLKIYLTLLKSIHIDDQYLISFVFQRPNGYEFKDRFKDGIHIIFPYLSLPYPVLKTLRSKVIEDVNKQKTFRRLPLINNTDDIIDEAVIEKNNWLMFGSSKPQLPPYLLTHVFDANLAIVENDFTTRQLVELLSIRKYRDITPHYAAGFAPAPSSAANGKKKATGAVSLSSIAPTTTAAAKKTPHQNNGKSAAASNPADSTALTSNNSANPNKYTVIEPCDNPKDGDTLTPEEDMSINNYELNVYPDNVLYDIIRTIIVKYSDEFPFNKTSADALQIVSIKVKAQMIYVNINDHYCPFLERNHTRKNPPIYILITPDTISLRCYDAECAHKKYPSPPLKMPKSDMLKIQAFIPHFKKACNYPAYVPGSASSSKDAMPLTISGSPAINGENVPLQCFLEKHDNDGTIVYTTASSTLTVSTSSSNKLDPNSPITNDLVDTVDIMRRHFPKNELRIRKDVPISKYRDDHGDQCYTLELEDKYCPIQEKTSDSVELVADITQRGMQIRSMENLPGVYGHSFPAEPVTIPRHFHNMIFVKYTTINNQTINNIYNNGEECHELLEFEEDKDIIKIMDDEYLNLLALQSLNGTHYDVAKFSYELNKDKYRCINPDKSIWYQWKNHFWVEGYDTFTIFLSEKLVVYLKNAKKLYEEYENYIVNNSLKAADIQTMKIKKISLVESLIKKLKTSSFKQAVLSEAAAIFYTNFKDFYSKLDESRHLLAFNNGVMNLKTMEFREGQPSDCISFSTKIDYHPYSIGKNPEMEYFIQQILPDNDKREYVLKFLASCLSGNVGDEKFYIWTGTGGNGKSKLIEMFDRCMGDYSFKLPVSLLTQKRQASNQASPELASTRGKRFGVLQEPGESEKLNIGLMKELTGGDKISCRALFRDQIEFKPQFHLVLACNSLPEIPSQDGGTWRRLRVVEFTSRFVESPDPTNPNEFKADKDLNDKMDKWTIDFMGYMIEYYKNYTQNGMKEPDIVLKYTNEYKKNCDSFKEWLDEHFVITNSQDDYILGTELHEKYIQDTGDKMSLTAFGKNIVKYTERKVMKGYLESRATFYLGIKYKNED